MTGREFMNAVANGQADILGVFLKLLAELGADYCVIGGLAVNAYAEPVISLDVDVVVAATELEQLADAAATYFKVERFAHSMNLISGKSDLRIQLQTDPRYQDFIANAAVQNVLGYEMKVAALADVLTGKLWAYADEQRRPSKRHKDLADISRLVEAHPALAEMLPAALRAKFEQDM